jgi:TatA/E family protein of Tat protein translocase
MMIFLLMLDNLLGSDMLIILAAALIFFGPRRLPQISRQIGKSLSEFRRASEDFKRTWEREVNLENLEKGVEPQEDHSLLDQAAERIRAAREVAAFDSSSPETTSPAITPSVTPVDPSLVQPRATPSAGSESQPAGPPLAKHDWL